MQIDIRELSEGHHSLTLSGRLDAEDYPWVADVEQPFEVVLTMSRFAKNINLQVQINATAVMVCDRCLEPFRQKISEAASRYIELHPSAMSSELSSEDDVIQLRADQREFDLTAIVAEHLQLGIPFKRLCSTDCLGLCSQCGINRNEKDCACDQPPADQRLAQLKKFKV
jgi:uncharacterized protein